MAGFLYYHIKSLSLFCIFDNIIIIVIACIKINITNKSH